jgi:hypothetical protein
MLVRASSEIIVILFLSSPTYTHCKYHLTNLIEHLINSNVLQDEGVFVRFLPELDNDVSCGSWLEAGDAIGRGF